MSLSRTLVELIRNKPVSDADLQAARLYVLDALANALAARATPLGRLLARWSRDQAQDAGRQAMLLGGLVHCLEVDDLHKASVVHPGCVVVPAAWSAALRQGRDGLELLRAVLQGFEACCRIGMAVGPAHYRIWHNTATCGPFGSAMAVAHLLGLDEDQAVAALGNAGTQSSGLWEFLETGANSKHLHAGRAAESGLIAADLARLGFSGPPRILEGRRGFFAATCSDASPEAVGADPQADWQLRQTSIKPWPCCRHTHPAIDAALELHQTLAGQDWRRLRLTTYAAALDVCDRPQPDSEYAAKFSLQHCVAQALVEGRVGFESFDSDRRAALQAQRARIELEQGEPYASDYPQRWGARLEVQTTDGRTYRAERRACLGDPENPLDETAMRDKAQALLAFGGVETQAARAWIEEIMHLDAGRALPDWPSGAVPGT